MLAAGFVNMEKRRVRKFLRAFFQGKKSKFIAVSIQEGDIFFFHQTQGKGFGKKDESDHCRKEQQNAVNNPSFQGNIFEDYVKIKNRALASTAFPGLFFTERNKPAFRALRFIGGLNPVM